MQKKVFSGNALIGVFFEAVFDLLKEKSACYAGMVQARIVMLLYEVMRCELAVPHKPVVGGMNKVLSHIEEHLDEALDITSLARQACLSVSWFKARFHQEVGMPS